MTKLAEEAATIVDSLPPDKAQALLDYARYLAEKADVEEWDRRLADPKYTAKLKQLAGDALADFRAGKTQPLDPDRM